MKHAGLFMADTGSLCIRQKCFNRRCQIQWIFVIKGNFTDGERIVNFIEHNIVFCILRRGNNMERSVTDNGKSVAVKRHIISCGNLIQIHEDVRRKAGVCKQLEGSAIQIASLTQGDKRNLIKMFQGYGRSICKPMPAGQNVLTGQPVLFQTLIDFKMGGNGQNQMFMLKELLLIFFKAKRITGQNKIQFSGFQRLGKLCVAGTFHKTDPDSGMKFGEGTDMERQTVTAVECAGPDIQGAGIKASQVVEIGRHIFLYGQDFFCGLNVEFPSLCKLDGTAAAIKKCRTEFVFQTLDSCTERRLRNIQCFGCLGETATLVDRIDIFHLFYHVRHLPF